MTSILDWKNTHRKYKECPKCGILIFYDESIKSEHGNLVKLDKDTGLPHKCSGRREEMF